MSYKPCPLREKKETKTIGVSKQTSNVPDLFMLNHRHPVFFFFQKKIQEMVRTEIVYQEEKNLKQVKETF